MHDDLEPVADAVLRIHDRMESTGARQVPTERVLDYLHRRYDLQVTTGGSEDRERVADVLNHYHGDLWVMGPRDESDVDLPTYVIVPEEMAYTIEKEILDR
jgi:hypothetical protein